MSHQQTELLVVDDEAFNRDILEERLHDAGYAVTVAADGEEAWEILNAGQHHFSSILLDRMMPRLDGMGLLKRIKADNRLDRIPVIFQTAAANSESVAEGLQAGAFYYLTKPFTSDVLLAIVRSAVNDYALVLGMHESARVTQDCLGLLHEGEFRLHTLQQARQLSHVLASLYPDPQRVAVGISELLINAVEHGNLGISYHDKTQLLQTNSWETEIERRLALPEYAGKEVTVRLKRTAGSLTISITDQGDGFNWKQYLEISPARAFDPNGRGIAMSRLLSFDHVEFRGKGNEVVASITLPG